MPSFDVVSEIDTHELTNAVDQAVRELGQRFDFKGTDARFELEETTVTLIAPADFQLKQMLDILKLKIAKRGIDIACLEVKDPEVNLARAKQLAVLKHGIDADAGRKVSRLIKDSKLRCRRRFRATRCGSPARSATICRKPSPFCARPTSECLCSSITFATDGGEHHHLAGSSPAPAPCSSRTSPRSSSRAVSETAQYSRSPLRQNTK
jgi:cyclic-di-GMP-binding protein